MVEFHDPTSSAEQNPNSNSYSGTIKYRDSKSRTQVHVLSRLKESMLRLMQVIQLV